MAAMDDEAAARAAAAGPISCCGIRDGKDCGIIINNFNPELGVRPSNHHCRICDAKVCGICSWASAVDGTILIEGAFGNNDVICTRHKPDNFFYQTGMRVQMKIDDVSGAVEVVVGTDDENIH